MKDLNSNNSRLKEKSLDKAKSKLGDKPEVEKEVKIKKPGLYSKFKNNLKTTGKDMLNPNSQFKGPGRILQLTGTANATKRIIDSVHSEHRMLTLTGIEKDKLIVDGFLKEVKLIDNTDKGNLPLTEEYYEAKATVGEHLKRTKKVNLKNTGSDSKNIDKTYSAWERFNTACDLIN